jgi:PAS domain S-box-containing protein
MRPISYGIDFYGDCLFTSENEIAKHPKRVKAFRQASLKGWQYAMDNPEEIVDLIVAKYKTEKSRDALLHEAKMTDELMLHKFVEIGHMNLGRWKHIADTFVSVGMMKPDYSLDGFIYDPDSNIDHTWLLWTAAIIAATAFLLSIFNTRLRRAVKKRTREIVLANKNLRASEQQLRASNQQLLAGEQQLRAANQQLKENEKRNRAWLENSPVCTKIVDLDFNLQYMSASGVNGLGIEDITEFYGKPYPLEFYPESFCVPMRANLQKVKDTGQIIEQEAPIVDTEGNELWFHSTVVPVNDDHGQIEYLIVVSMDITERKQAEHESEVKGQQLHASNQQLMASEQQLRANDQQLRAANQQLRANELELEKTLKTLENKNEELQSIVYVASHDLKSPIVNINGFGNLLWKSCEKTLNIIQSKDIAPAEKIEKIEPIFTEDIYESLEFISSGTKKSQALLDALLKVSRIGSVEIQIQPLDMNALISDIKNTVEFQLNEKNILMTVEQLPNCRGDSDQINQVFSNLIDNAIKYRHQDRKAAIDVSAKTKNGYTTYCIADNGIGIEPDHQKKVFELFHRLNPDSSEDGEGIGLTIISRILSRHDGQITVESQPGENSKFYVTLPSA